MDKLQEDKFNHIYDLYAKSLFSVIYPYFNNKIEAEDILQDVFLVYLEKKIKLEGEELKYYLIRVAINKSINALKNRNRNNLELLESYDYQVSESKVDSGVLDAIYKLDVKYKSVILLFYYEDYPIEKIAHILHISISAAKMRLKRARELLKVLLED